MWDAVTFVFNIIVSVLRRRCRLEMNRSEMKIVVVHIFNVLQLTDALDTFETVNKFCLLGIGCRQYLKLQNEDGKNCVGKNALNIERSLYHNNNQDGTCLKLPFSRAGIWTVETTERGTEDICKCGAGGTGHSVAAHRTNVSKKFF